LGRKIAEARSQKIPYLVVYGPRDVEKGTVSVRLRDDTELEPMSIEAFIDMARRVEASKAMALVPA
jgi:threonyl-tRNA synthetase